MAPTTPGTPAPTLQALLDALADRPDTTVAEVAAAAGIGRSTASKLLATQATQGRVLRRPGGHQGGRRTPDHWTLITAGSSSPAGFADHPTSPATPPAEVGPPRPAPGRLGAGQLRDLVEACLAERPNQALSATAIATTLDRSAGAIANALQVLASQGRVIQAHTSPRRYRIADARDPAMTRTTS
jgi:predicted transcriptional regulator